jgi:hypothetical protein
MRRVFVCAAALVLPSVSQAEVAAGRLVIAGGAVARTNLGVHQAMIARLGDAGRVAVIPAASGEPVQ